MAQGSVSSDFKALILNKTKLIDVRAPIEFEKGAFPYAVNLPFMNDEERHLIGIRYKEAGNAKAVELGYELVGGAKQQERTQGWLDFMSLHPDALLYCFRGGQRSGISQEWIQESGHEITRLKGGYKAFRTYLMNEIEESVHRFKPIILGGRTGSGKTILLKKLNNAIDLEGLSNHRGSAFGRKTTEQPTQINFENTLAYDLVEKLEQGFNHLVFEDEGSHIGNVYIPKIFAAYLKQAPRVILQTPMQERVETTVQEYMIDAQKMYDGEDALFEWKEQFQASIDRIRKRLGNEKHKEICTLFSIAFDKQIQDNSFECYDDLVEYLLREYYDPMYDYQIDKIPEQVVFRGSHEEVIDYLQQFSHRTLK